jgi:hypothetical protein
LQSQLQVKFTWTEEFQQRVAKFLYRASFNVDFDWPLGAAIWTTPHSAEYQWFTGLFHVLLQPRVAAEFERSLVLAPINRGRLQGTRKEEFIIELELLQKHLYN